MGWKSRTRGLPCPDSRPSERHESVCLIKDAVLDTVNQFRSLLGVALHGLRFEHGVQRVVAVAGGVPDAVAMERRQQDSRSGWRRGQGGLPSLIVALKPDALTELPSVDYLDARGEAYALHTHRDGVGIVQVQLTKVADCNGNGCLGR